MSLSRAFTTRRNKPSLDGINSSVSSLAMNFQFGRSAAAARPGKVAIRRHDISGPVALVSTTNMLSYEAPDIAGTAPIAVQLAQADSSSARRSSVSSGDEDGAGGSDRSTLHSGHHSPAASTDNSSVDLSPVSPPEQNHLSCYFRPPMDSSSPTAHPSSPTPDAPDVPRRVPSHSKKAHEHLHYKRSLQRMLSPAAAANSASSDSAHPFGGELHRQLDAVAESYSSNALSADDDTAERAYLSEQNLLAFSASEYLAEIQSLIYAHLADEEQLQQQPPAWI